MCLINVSLANPFLLLQVLMNAAGTYGTLLDDCIYGHHKETSNYGQP